MHNVKKQMTFYIPKTIANELRIWCIQHESTLSALVNELLAAKHKEIYGPQPQPQPQPDEEIICF